MQRIPPDHPVRRRLFAEDDPDNQATLDNRANVLQELAARDKEEKIRRWNFDFKNEVPLQGEYEWVRCDGNVDWIGTNKAEEPSQIDQIDPEKEQDNFLPMQLENETTPKSSKEEAANLVRKRRNDLDSDKNKEVRRRI